MRHRVERRLVAIIIATASIVGISRAPAADWSPYTPVYKAPANQTPIYKPSVYGPAAFTWAGFYIGGNLGYGWSSGSGTVAFGGATGDFSGSGSAVSLGSQLGYNWQTGAMVLGLESDIQAGFGSGNVTGSAGTTTFTGTGKNPVFGTLRGRIGYAFDKTLIYATGGMGYGLATLEGSVSTTGAFASAASYYAWTVGAGVEYALWNRWSAKLEYLHAGSPSSAPTAPGVTAMSGSSQSHLVRTGLNYRF